jgi:hypothetical protein
MVSSLLVAVAITFCDVREIVFVNGFRARLPRAVCVTRTDNPDSAIYQFTIGRDTRPILEAYAGNAADFFYFAPEDGVGRSEACGGPLRIAETTRGNVTQVGGAADTTSGHCGEVLVRRPARKGHVASSALHFWYSRLSPSEERLARGIIDAVEAR